MVQAVTMNPEAVVYEIEDLQDRLVLLTPPDADFCAVQSVYRILARAKLRFRRKM